LKKQKSDAKAAEALVAKKAELRKASCLLNFLHLGFIGIFTGERTSKDKTR
jgi:hypothetical protein